MTNPASTRRAPAPDPFPFPTDAPRRRRLARALPLGTALLASVLLATAAAVDGRAAALVLALWVAVLVVVGTRLSQPALRTRSPGPRVVRRPVLVLANLSGDGALGATRTLPVVASPEAIAVIDSRPSG